MSRFFVLPEQIHNDVIEITGSDVKHIKDVLRYTKGTGITVCASNASYECIIEEVLPAKVNAVILNKTLSVTEPYVKTYLYQGLPKGDKMDLIIQKNIELGIEKIIPVIMERTIVRLDEKDKQKKNERWNRIAMEAAKQCGRQSIPEVLLPISFNDMIASTYGKIKIMPYENENDRTLKSLLQSVDKTDLSIDILIGPEGGISLNEVNSAIESGFIPVTLGKRILRTETAGFAVSSCIRYEFED